MYLYIGSQGARSSLFHPSPGVSCKSVERGFQLVSHQFQHTWGPMASEIWIDFAQVALSWWLVGMNTTSKLLEDYDPETDHWYPPLSIYQHLSASGSDPALSTQKLLFGQQLVMPLVVTSARTLGTCCSLLTLLPTAACRDQVGSTPWPPMVP